MTPSDAARGDPRLLRLAAVRDRLARVDLDGVLLTHLANVRYLTGFSGTSALLFVSARECLLFTDFRYAGQVEEELGTTTAVQIEQTSLWTGLWSWLAGITGVERIGFESGHLAHRDFARLLEQGQRWHWRPVTELVEELRAVKDAGEIVAIERAVVMAEAALQVTLPQIHPGMTELAVAGLLERALRDEGSEAFPFPTIVAAGPRSALPHARAGDRLLQPSDLLLLDFGAVADGYCADLTRTVVVGPSTEDPREVHAIVREANLRASGAVRAGMTGMAADAVARDYIASFGYGEAFGHSLGHGIGLEVHEAPRLARSVETVLQPGSVVTIEPGIYRGGWGGVRIEDDVLVTESGRRVLSSFSRELLELD